MPRYIAILFALPLLLSSSESAEAKMLAQKKAADKEVNRTAKGVDLKYAYVSPRCGRRSACGGVWHEELNVSVAKTATGAIAKYSFYSSRSEESENLEVELDIEEWLNFIRMLNRSNFIEWENFKNPDEEVFKGWKVFIHYLDKESARYGDYIKFPPNWNEFKKAIDYLDAKIRNKVGAEEGQRPYGWQKGGE